MSERPVPPFAALRAFEKVGQEGGVRRAAQALGVTHAIVGRHIVTLEEFLGVMLLNRKTGELTPVGRDYHARISVAIEEMRAATASILQQQTGTLSIWCPPGFAMHWLVQRVGAFSAQRRRGDDWTIDIRSTNAQPSFERNEADVHIRYKLDGETAPLPSGVREEELARTPVFVVAAPRLLAGLREPIRTVSDIVKLPLIQDSIFSEWSRWFEALGLDDIGNLPAPIARYDQANCVLAAARAGQGLALANHFMVADELAAGTLVAVHAEGGGLFETMFGSYSFCCARSRWSDPVISRFRRWLQKEIGAQDIGVNDHLLQDA